MWQKVLQESACFWCSLSNEIVPHKEKIIPVLWIIQNSTSNSLTKNVGPVLRNSAAALMVI